MADGMDRQGEFGQASQTPLKPSDGGRAETPHEKAQRQFLVILSRVVNYKLIWVSVLLFMLGSAVVYLTYEQSKTHVGYYIAQEIGKAIFITALVSGAIKWYITRQSVELDEELQRLERSKQETFRDELAKTLDRLHHEREEGFRQQVQTSVDNLYRELTLQTTRIGESASSLGALQQAGVAKVYASRSDASEDIKRVMEHPDLQEIKIIGISLNDFVRDENIVLHSAMEQLKRRIRAAGPDGRSTMPQTPLSVQILVIDPDSRGAFLRAHAEQKEDRGRPRLRSDVENSIEYFRPLEQQSTDLVRLEARLYRSDPMLYLVWTPAVSFVHQYYFRPSHTAGINLPLLRYQKRLDESSTDSRVHDELRHHFDWVWNHASIPIADYREKSARGVDTAIRQANIRNIYYDSTRSRERILHLIQTAQTHLWIKGVSLQSFFRNGVIFSAISNACRRGVKVEVLLIDHEGEQARFRSFREYLLRNKDARLDEFTAEKLRDQRLFTDTAYSLRFIESQVDRGELPGLSYKVFWSAPESFLLLTDDAVLIEQYHYGTITPGESQDNILGGEVPVVEYKRFDDVDEADELIRGRDRLKDPYRIYKDHFRYVFDHCAITPSSASANGQPASRPPWPAQAPGV